MSRPLIERVVRQLAALERPSASDGERRAAELVADELRAAGCSGVRVEEERAHGGYWWPLGLLNAGALLAARRGRLPAAVAGALAAAAVYDDVGGGRLWSAFSWRSGMRSIARRGSAGWKTSPEWAASWWETKTTVRSPSGSPASATTFQAERCGSVARRNQSRPPLTSS